MGERSAPPHQNPRAKPPEKPHVVQPALRNGTLFHEHSRNGSAPGCGIPRSVRGTGRNAFRVLGERFTKCRVELLQRGTVPRGERVTGSASGLLSPVVSVSGVLEPRVVCVAHTTGGTLRGTPLPRSPGSLAPSPAGWDAVPWARPLARTLHLTASPFGLRRWHAIESWP